MRYTPIKTQAIIFLVIAMVLPILLIGAVSTIYYRDVIRQSIWEGNLDQAKEISAFSTNYVDSALLYIESQASRPSVYEAVNKSNTAFLNNTIMHIQNSSMFYAVYATDSSGTIMSSYPYELVGRNDKDKIWVKEALDDNTGYVSDAMKSVVTGKPAIYISAPIRNNNSTNGVLVGALDLYYYSKFVAGSPLTRGENIYLVNRSGYVMLHTNMSAMDAMTYVADRPGVKKALMGEEGVIEQYNTQEKEYKLASYSPITKYGWGALVTIPVNAAYGPINNATFWFLVFTCIMILLAIAAAGLISTNIVEPVLHMTTATHSMPYGDYKKDLPLVRQDEIGDLARSFDHMAGDIRDSQQKIEAARDRAEEEKNRAELYVDIMGHDINNLNQTALANLELIETDPELPEDLQEYIQSAIRSIEGSAGIIENVRKIQQITGEKLHLEKEDVHDLITRCIEEAHKPQDKKVTINYTGRPGMIISGTPLLKEVFCNIIGNSIKYSGPEVTVDIDTREVSDVGKKFYEITIADNGYGIPDEVKGRLFRRFERGTAKAHGKGLGLYIVKMLIERFGGTVTIEDRVPGDYEKGAKFIVRLPAA